MVCRTNEICGHSNTGTDNVTETKNKNNGRNQKGSAWPPKQMRDNKILFSGDLFKRLKLANVNRKHQTNTSILYSTIGHIYLNVFNGRTRSIVSYVIIVIYIYTRFNCFTLDIEDKPEVSRLTLHWPIESAPYSSSRPSCSRVGTSCKSPSTGIPNSPNETEAKRLENRLQFQRNCDGVYWNISGA